MNNVAVFDYFDVLAYPDDHPTHPNRLKLEYGGDQGDSHPNAAADAAATQDFATSFIDQAWDAFHHRQAKRETEASGYLE